VRVYHFVNRQYGLENLAKRRLKIARWNDLNDPFELAAANFADKELRRAMVQTKDQLNDRHGMLCFSRNWQNPVQWSHYAEKHRGVCLAFDVDDDLVQPVNYVADRLSLTKEQVLSEKGERTEELMLQMLFTKYKDWKYEEEVRVMATLSDEDGGHYFYPFDAHLVLKGVIVGPRSTISRAEVAVALGDQAGHVETWKARLGFNRFEIVRNMSASLWK